MEEMIPKWTSDLCSHYLFLLGRIVCGIMIMFGEHYDSHRYITVSCLYVSSSHWPSPWLIAPFVSNANESLPCLPRGTFGGCRRMVSSFTPLFWPTYQHPRGGAMLLENIWKKMNSLKYFPSLKDNQKIKMNAYDRLFRFRSVTNQSNLTGSFAIRLLTSEAVSGVAVVCSVAFFIAFILPCGCFIATQTAVPSVAEGGDRHDSWIQAAWAIMIFSFVVAIVCTINTVGFSSVRWWL